MRGCAIGCDCVPSCMAASSQASHQRCHRRDDTQEALTCFIVRAGARDAGPAPKSQIECAPSLVCSPPPRFALAPADSGTTGLNEGVHERTCVRGAEYLCLSVCLSAASVAYAIRCGFYPRARPGGLGVGHSPSQQACQPGHLPRQAAKHSVSSRPMQDIHRIGQQ